MELLHIFLASSMPIVKTFLLIFLGSFLAWEPVHVLGPTASKHINQVVYFVFNPALMGSTLARTITFRSLLTLWFMPVNILCSYILGSALGWLLVKLTKPPKHLKGLIIGSCSAGNVGYMLVIIVPAVCKGKGSPLGEPERCSTYALSYTSLSMALGSIYVWMYVYNIIRISSKEIVEIPSNDQNSVYEDQTQSRRLPSSMEHPPITSMIPLSSNKMKGCLTNMSKRINLQALLAPSTIGAIVGFVIGTIPPLKKLLIGNDAPLYVIEDAASLLGNAAVPTLVLILGANLLRGLKGSGVQYGVIIGILVVRYIFLPLLGILIIRAAVRLGLVQSDPLFQFVLLLQHAVPPAMTIGTITQLFGAGQKECSVIMLWSYSLASISLTLWCTLFLWLVAL